MAGKIDDRPNLILFGDSITVGEYVSPHQTWAVMLSASVAERYPHWRTIIAARNGDTTRQALERMPFDVQRYERIDLLVIQFGHNDANRWDSDPGCPRVPVYGYRANLDEIVDRGRLLGARELLIPPHEVDRPQLKTSLDMYRWGCVASFAKGDRFVLPLIDPHLHLIDGLHLNEEGHRVYHDAICPRVLEIIKRLECSTS